MKLLVSVRNAAEARIALDGGANLIDIKEPSRGALGRPDSEEIARVVAEVGGKVSVSAALGELFDTESESPLVLSPHDKKHFAGLQFAKYGLSGALNISNWQDHWRAAICQLPAGVLPVAVAYADWKTCAAPSPDDVLEIASKVGCAAILVDTFNKSRGGLLEHLSLNELAAIIDRAKRFELLTVVGGSLGQNSIREVARILPDVIAVRTAICLEKRTGQIDFQKVRELGEFIAELIAKTRLKSCEKFA